MKSLKFRNIILLFLILISVKNVNSQSFELTAFLDTNVIEIGDQTYFNLQVRQPKNFYIQFPNIQDELIEGIEVLSKTGIDTLPATQTDVILTQKFLITSFEDSLFVIPQFDFFVDTTAFKTDSMYLAVTLLDVDSTFLQNIDTTQTIPIFGIKEPINTPLTFSEFWQYNKVWILILLFSFILIFTIYYFVKRHKENRPIRIFEKPKEPAHIIALRKLNELKEKKLWQQDRIKEYYTELTDILREYIEERFFIQTFEKTSNEIIRDVEIAKIFDNEILEKLRFILFHSDLVKFAKGKPLADENDISLQNAFYIIDKTKPATTVIENKDVHENN